MALLVVLVLIRSVLIRLVFLFASEGLHQKMLSSILKAPILFFDTNPSGKLASFMVFFSLLLSWFTIAMHDSWAPSLLFLSLYLYYSVDRHKFL